MRHMLNRIAAIRAWLVAALALLTSGTAAVADGWENDCGFTAGPVRMVTRIIDGDTVILDDGNRVRLTGIQAPELPHDARTASEWPYGKASARILTDLVKGHRVRLYYDGARHDRYGRILAHLRDQDSAEGAWIQALMLQRGAALVYTFPDNNGCARQMLRHEASARSGGVGLWRLPRYGVRKATDIAELAALVGTFQLIRGRVVNIGRDKRLVYINFSRDWKTDFTVTVEKRVLERFPDDFFAKLAGKRIEIRGWLEFRNGPWIRLTHPQQLVILG